MNQCKLKLFLIGSFFFTLISNVFTEVSKPNIIIIFCDDLGYGDLGCYGATKQRTPEIDKLARQGMKFTDFYVSSPVCTPSRSSLLTGSYPRRIGMHEDYTGHWVLVPKSRRGLNPKEVTLPEMLKTNGYSTACIGKWHLGDQVEHLPTQHGFEYYFGIPYSNDMKRSKIPLPLVIQNTVVEAPADQTTLTKRYTEEVISFIEKSKNNPFFIYMPHTFPHLPLYSSPDFHGKSGNGPYGDSIEEIDWSTGEIMKCLERLKLKENTLVIFTSDNGSNGRNGGSNKPLSGIKGSTMEGGMRVPLIAHWPNRVPKNAICRELSSTMDFLPTIAALTASKLPSQKMDGFDISAMLFGDEEAKTKYEAFYYYRRRQLQAVRYGDWKYHLPLKHTYPKWTTPDHVGMGRSGKLVNLKTDLQENNNVANAHPEIIQKMEALAKKMTDKLGNNKIQGYEQRSAKTLEKAVPMLLKN